jgi:general secretion pathway protein M
MSLRERMDKLEPRERRLLTGFAVVVGALLFLSIPIYIFTTVSSKRQENQEIADLIQTIKDNRAQIGERKAKHDALLAKYARQAPPLAGFFETIAKENGITVPEWQDRPELPHGKRYNERSGVAKLHKVGMLAVATSLEKIEQSGFPLSISRLSLKPRNGEADSYEVELGISAFDRKPDAPAASPTASASAAPTSAPEGVP